jgi:hypothetical protein
MQVNVVSHLIGIGKIFTSEGIFLPVAEPLDG